MFEFFFFCLVFIFCRKYFEVKFLFGIAVNFIDIP